MANPLDDIITDVIAKEGGSKATNDSADKGGRTQYGISAKSNPKAWEDGKVTEEEARAIYLQKYVVGVGLHLIPPSHKKTQANLIDWGVMSGPGIAVKELQKIVGAEQDGVFGSMTLQKLLAVDDRSLSNLLAASRVAMVGRVVQRNPSQVKWLGGWLKRALDFIT